MVFKLYDTYGFPTDLTADIAREHQLKLDMAGFEQRMAVQRQLSRDTGQFAIDLSATSADKTIWQSVFTGYEQFDNDSVVMALFEGEQAVNTLTINQPARVILAQTPFYAESGGQVGDKGILLGSNIIFEVADTKKMGKAHVHLGKLTAGTLQVGDQLQAKIDFTARQATARNHSATHLLHAALRQILGEHVKQKGSLVEPERLRFDFAHFEPLTSEQLLQIEQLVNQHILANNLVQTRLMALEEALTSGAMALFGEKYDEQVRVLSMGNFSTELCGGTHVRQTGEIGLFKITAETGIAAGVRRIEALTGTYAFAWITTTEKTLNQIMELLKTNRDSVTDRVGQLLEQSRSAEKELVRLQAKLASSQGSDLANQAIEINGIKILAVQLENVDIKQLRHTLDQLKNKLTTAVIVLAMVKAGKVTLLAGITSNLTHQFKAGELVNHVAQQVGGKGGGRPDMAQAGGNDPTHLETALQSVIDWVKLNY